MKFRLPKSQLTQILDKASMALPTRSTSSILLGLLIEIEENGSMKITGSDNEIRIEQTLQLTDFEAGKIVLPGKLFVNIIRSMPDEEITVTCGEDHVASVTTSRSSFRIAALDANEYPLSDPYIDDKKIIIQKEKFINMINKTTFAASRMDSRGVLVGALLDIREDQLIMVALDGFRMVVIRSTLETASEKPAKIIIAARILNEIVKLIASPDFQEETIEIGFNEARKNAQIATENLRVTISLISGNFLNYESLLPSRFATEAVVEKESFRRGIERAALMSTDGRNNLVKLKFAGDSLKITAKSDSGNLEDSFPIVLRGPDIEIGFNSKYILDGLKAIDTDNLIFSLETSIKPCTITPEETGEYTYMILPVRVS